MTIFRNVKEEFKLAVDEIKKDLFIIKNKTEIALLVNRLGISQSEACDFLYKNYRNKITFKEYFKEKYYSQWVPCGNTEYGRTKMIYTYEFPKRPINFTGTCGTYEFDWNRLLKNII